MSQSSSSPRTSSPFAALFRKEESFCATDEEREILRQLGDAGACKALQLPRSTLCRIGAGWSVRRGTMAVFRYRLDEWREKQAKLAAGANK